MKNSLVCALILAAASGAACSCSSGDGYRRAEGAAWGTTYHMVYKSADDLSDSIVAEMRRVEMSLSMFDDNSTVSRVNAGLTDTVDGYFVAVMAVCDRVNKASGGMFDPTVAPLTDLWGFGRKGRDTLLPDSASVADALVNVGFGKCRLEGPVVVRPEGMEFDFSAVAKGFGVDCVAAMLRRNGCTDYMVEIGGEVSVSGVNPSGRVWHIQVDSPSAELPGESGLAVLELTDCALATSGNYRNRRAVSPDSVVGHTIDPSTGYPRQRSVVSATVVSPSCALSDALATACMLLDTAEARAMLRRFPATSAMLCLSGDRIVEIP